MVLWPRVQTVAGPMDWKFVDFLNNKGYEFHLFRLAQDYGCLNMIEKKTGFLQVRPSTGDLKRMRPGRVSTFPVQPIRLVLRKIKSMRMP